MSNSNALGQIVRIVDKETVIVNVGSSQLQEEDRIVVYEVSDKIYDLEGNLLGDYTYNKDILEVICTEEHFSFCQKIQYFEDLVLPLTTPADGVSVPLNINEQDIESFTYTPYIKIGDFVRKVN